MTEKVTGGGHQVTAWRGSQSWRPCWSLGGAWSQGKRGVGRTSNQAADFQAWFSIFETALMQNKAAPANYRLAHPAVNLSKAVETSLNMISISSPSAHTGRGSSTIALVEHDITSPSLELWASPTGSYCFINWYDFLPFFAWTLPRAKHHALFSNWNPTGPNLCVCFLTPIVTQQPSHTLGSGAMICYPSLYPSG